MKTIPLNDFIKFAYEFAQEKQKNLLKQINESEKSIIFESERLSLRIKEIYPISLYSEEFIFNGDKSQLNENEIYFNLEIEFYLRNQKVVAYFKSSDNIETIKKAVLNAINLKIKCLEEVIKLGKDSLNYLK
jgi:hypothetical protein